MLFSERRSEFKDQLDVILVEGMSSLNFKRAAYFVRQICFGGITRNDQACGWTNYIITRSDDARVIETFEDHQREWFIDAQAVR